MYRDNLIATAIMKAENGEIFHLNYFIRIIESETEMVYALRVDKNNWPNGGSIESESTPAFCDDYARTLQMAEAFANGQVTPCVLIEMCDEWVSGHGG